MEVVGYALIKKDAKSGVSPIDINEFIGKVVRVYEFAKDGGVLVMNLNATGLATFDKIDIQSKFECTEFAEIICPPDLEIKDKVIYTTNVVSRIGGYSDILKKMVIAASINKGKFEDSFLWAK